MSRNGNWNLSTLVAVALLCGGCTGATSGPATNPLITANKPKPWSQTIAGAGKQVGDALTIQPGVDPANDPTRLSSTHKPIGSELYLRSARLMEAKGDLRAAETHYERAVQTAPRKIEPLIAMARFYDRRSRFDKATGFYQRAVKLDPRHSGASNDLGLCLSRAGKNQESIAALQRAIKLKPKKVLYRNNIATVLISVKRVNEALSHLSAVHPPAIAHYNLGFLLTQQSMHALARTHLEKALSLDQDLEAARLVLAKLPNGKRLQKESTRIQALPVSDRNFEQQGAYGSVGDDDIEHLPPIK